jgi:hypothetical protein
MEVNERFIKITSKVPFEKELKKYQSVKLYVVGDVVKVESGDNQDGTEDIIYKVKPTEIHLLEE